MSHDDDDFERSRDQDRAVRRIQRLSRRTFARRAVLVSAGVALAPLLFACGGEDDEDEDGEEQEQDEEEDQGGGDEPGEDV